MDKSEILKHLEDDSKYYGEFGKQFLSNSDIGKLLKNPTQFRVNQEMTKPMLEGRYFHTKILEPQKIGDFIEVDVTSRNTVKYKEAIKEGEMLLLTKEREHLDFLCTKMTSNMEMFDYIYDDGNQFEIPEIQKIMSLDWKGKADIVNHNKGLLVDIKTSGDIDKFMYSAKTYNYDSQAYIYSTLFGYEMLFIVIDKQTMEIGMYDCSPQFYERGKDKVEKAIEAYKLFYDTEGFDPKQYFVSKTL
jgi:hypothetical protein